MRCPKCRREKNGELQAMCTYCGHTEGSDRWFSTDDESTRQNGCLPF